jgi:hypothetical protein
MTVKEFQKLPDEEQFMILKERGVLIGQRENDHHYARLYRIDGFYMELFFLRWSQRLWKYHSLDHEVILTPYLDQINIDQLFQ